MQYVRSIVTQKTWAIPDEDEHWAAWCQKEDGFQLERLEKALLYVKQRKIAVDVGAHIGTWTNVLARSFATIYAFEPVPNTFKCLIYNTNDIKNIVQRFPYALGSTTGFVHMKMGDRGKKKVWNTGGYYVQPDGNIKMITLDSLQLPGCDFLKIDVEGYELEVLKGARKTILKYRPVLYIEIGKNATSTFGASRHETREYLSHVLGLKCIWRFKADHVYQ